MLLFLDEEVVLVKYAIDELLLLLLLLSLDVLSVED
jgi:hypothetical protein